MQVVEVSTLAKDGHETMTEKTKVKPPLAAVTLPTRDWVRVVHAVESSFQRKTKRGEHKAADEMTLIGLSILQQAGLRK
jgi:hypothetical protein